MAKQKKRPKKVWLSRNKNVNAYDEGTTYQLWKCKPKVNAAREQFWLEHDDSVLSTMCSRDFELFTGFHLEPGEYVQVRIFVELA